MQRRGRGTRRHGPLPKIFALVLTSLLTFGVAAWAIVSQPSGSPVTPPRAVFLGDSYTTGVGGDGADWPTMVSRDLGWSAVNLAAGGTGYATAAQMAGCGKPHCGAYLEQSRSIPDRPDVIVIAGGRNDPVSSIGPAALKLFTSLREKHPEAVVIALSPWTDDAAPDDSFKAKAAAVRDAAEDAGIVFIDTGQPFVGHSDLISADGIHPNAAGYTKLSGLLAPMLAKATVGHIDGRSDQ